MGGALGAPFIFLKFFCIIIKEKEEDKENEGKGVNCAIDAM